MAFVTKTQLSALLIYSQSIIYFLFMFLCFLFTVQSYEQSAVEEALKLQKQVGSQKLLSRHSQAKYIINVFVTALLHGDILPNKIRLF